MSRKWLPQYIKCFFIPCKVVYIPCKLALGLVPPSASCRAGGWFPWHWALLLGAGKSSNIWCVFSSRFQHRPLTMWVTPGQVSPGDKQLSLGRSDLLQQQWHQVCRTSLSYRSRAPVYEVLWASGGFFCSSFHKKRQEECKGVGLVLVLSAH